MNKNLKLGLVIGSVLLVAIAALGMYQSSGGIVVGYRTSVASATTMNLSSGSVFNVTGTAVCDSIRPGAAGKIVWLVSASTDTLTDGKNLKLAGSFNGTASDVICLVSDGTNWIEVSRSVN